MKPLTSFLFSLVFTLLVTANLSADTIFTTDFGGTAGTIPTSFTTPTGTTDLALNGSGDYRLTSASNTLSLYNGAGSSALTDYTISTAFRQGAHINGTYVGLVARYVDATHFYHARLIGTTGSTWTMELYKFNGTVTSIATASLVSYTIPQTYRLELTVDGDSVLFQIYDKATAGSIVGTLMATDSALTAGTAGIRATSSGAAIAYENFTISTVSSIPEPASAALLAGVALLGVALMQRSRRSS